MKTAGIIASAVVLLAGAAEAQGGWRPLFDGKTLEGWYPCNGTAPFTVEDGAIKGSTVVGSPNSFLCTKQAFGDFILEYDVWVNTNLNSGVQIRSIAVPAVKKGRVHGLQVEVDPSDRAWTGGIYDEARRGWLHTLTDQPAARKAFRMGQWNTFRVEAIGTSIRTWVNGVPCANIVDELTPSGVLALQVHAIGSAHVASRRPDAAEPAHHGRPDRLRPLGNGGVGRVGGMGMEMRGPTAIEAAPVS